MLAVFAEFEREILSERVRAGLAEARLKGQRLGRPTTAARKAAEVRKLFRKGISNPKSPGGWRSDAPPYGAFWPDRFPGEMGRLRSLSQPTHCLSPSNLNPAPKWLWMLLLQPNPSLWTAIEHRRMIRLLYHGKNRILEPHDHGILNGSVQLLAYQVGGSSSRPLPNWVLMKENDITGLELLDQIFPGGRPTASGKHLKWDGLFIRVQPADDHRQASSA
jgi:hypothetical protein